MPVKVVDLLILIFDDFIRAHHHQVIICLAMGSLALGLEVVALELLFGLGSDNAATLMLSLNGASVRPLLEMDRRGWLQLICFLNLCINGSCIVLLLIRAFIIEFFNSYRRVLTFHGQKIAFHYSFIITTKFRSNFLKYIQGIIRQRDRQIYIHS